ncbi:outer membrane lipid asymmetry maintenance protein MlaD [Rickettsia endosymbiont of Cardiosporidium cionae]|uniref:outer membrane lipid asymmetry maintenance protein MlaD n=1 Tax=Rickettsia endosymbiont of Cardiosporidium cionae TaxID=2777155 RepID=UPI001893FE5B|nr:outer membrane lipid asymmetry maintenance protein MlaD [Rickettsia endosymbiont of Cardiosporidium cionae]KAF8818784.1 outer membrane lipid asymmetry maintenance protein MlaD [Rickettsia endosymbiont of Cardiosporidium cionae]
MKYSLFEVIVGMIVLLLAVAAFIFFYKNSNMINDNQDGYELSANFQNINGIKIYSDVKISGVKIGYVKNIILNSMLGTVELALCIKNDVLIPNDSQASILTNGVLGNKYININIGSSNINLTNNNKFVFTQSSINLENILEKLIYSLTTKN